MTATWGRETSRGITRAVIATIFALALVAWMAIPAIAQEADEEAGDGLYIGEVTAVEHDSQRIHFAGVFLGEDIPEELEDWFEQEEVDAPMEVYFDLDEDTDTFLLNLDDVSKEAFLNAAEASIGTEHIFAAGYQQDDGEQSLFALFTEEEDEEPENGPEEEEEEHAEPVERAERVETGAGGTAPGGLGGLALLLGMITVAGATFLRKASETS